MTDTLMFTSDLFMEALSIYSSNLNPFSWQLHMVNIIYCYGHYEYINHSSTNVLHKETHQLSLKGCQLLQLQKQNFFSVFAFVAQCQSSHDMTLYIIRIVLSRDAPRFENLGRHADLFI